MANTIDNSSSSKVCVSYTLFPSIWPKSFKRVLELPWTRFLSRLKALPPYEKKSDCPLISMCEYGENLSSKGYLRWGENVVSCWGCEFDYDGGLVSIERAGVLLSGVCSVLYTSPSHTDSKPRWRVLLPFSTLQPAFERARMVGRANALLGGIASRESFTLSQSFYFGRVKGTPFRVVETSGVCIDELSDLEPLFPNGKHDGRHLDESSSSEELLEAFRLGVGRYEVCKTLSARWALRGQSAAAIRKQLIELLEQSNPHNADGLDLRKRVSKLAESAVAKFGPKGVQLTEVRVIGPKMRPAAVTPLPPLPDGLVAEVAEWARKRSFSVNPKLDLGVALTAVAFATLNRYLVDGWNTPLQPYVMGTARTGGGKTETSKSVVRFAQAISRGGFQFVDHMVGGFQSHHAFSDKLAEEPHAVFWNWDEAARTIKGARSGPDYDVMTHLIKMFGQANDIVLGIPGRNSPIPTIEHPFLVVLALAQPNQLVAAVTQTDFDTGLLARFLLLDSGESIPRRNDNRSNLLSSSIVRHARAFREIEDISRFDRIPFASGVYSASLEFDDHARKMMGKSELCENFWSRATQHAMIIAGILAVSRSVTAPMVTRDLLDYAAALATDSISSWISRFSGESAGANWYEKLLLRIKQFLSEPSRFEKRARKNERELLAEGWVSRSLIIRSVQNNRRKDIDEVLEQLIDGSQVQRKLIGSMTVYRLRQDC